MRTEIINIALVKTISNERLSKYLIEMNNDLDSSLALYEYNTRISEAFYIPLQSLEVCMRNILNKCMSETYGHNWFQGDVPELKYEQQNEIYDAYEELGGLENTPNGAVIAKLKFAFWVGLIAPHYDATLWRKSLHKGFRATTGKKRSEVHNRLNAIRRFRNRVAHHEPVFNKDLKTIHDEIIEAISWMCKDTSAWTKHMSRVPSIIV